MKISIILLIVLIAASCSTAQPVQNTAVSEAPTLPSASDALDDPATRQRMYIDAERILCEQEAIIIPVSYRSIQP